MTWANSEIAWLGTVVVASATCITAGALEMFTPGFAARPLAIRRSHAAGLIGMACVTVGFLVSVVIATVKGA